MPTAPSSSTWRCSTTGSDGIPCSGTSVPLLSNVNTSRSERPNLSVYGTGASPKSCEAMKHEEFQEAMKHSKEAFAERQKKDPNYKEEGSDSNVDTYLYSRCVP